MAADPEQWPCGCSLVRSGDLFFLTVYGMNKLSAGLQGLSSVLACGTGTAGSDEVTVTDSPAGLKDKELFVPDSADQLFKNTVAARNMDDASVDQIG